MGVHRTCSGPNEVKKKYSRTILILPRCCRYANDAHVGAATPFGLGTGLCMVNAPDGAGLLATATSTWDLADIKIISRSDGADVGAAFPFGTRTRVTLEATDMLHRTTTATTTVVTFATNRTAIGAWNATLRCVPSL